MNWISVSDSLPEVGHAVLVTNGEIILVGQREDAPCLAGEKKWQWIACGVSGYEWDWVFDAYYAPDPVTHWMPLPDCPVPRVKPEETA